MASFNKIILLGNLTRDPELRQNQNANSMLAASIAVNEPFMAKDGFRRENTLFVEFAAFGKTAENMAKLLKKGSQTLIEGRLRRESWTDKQTGQNRSKLSVVADKFELLQNRNDCQKNDNAQQHEFQENTDGENVPF